MKRLVGWCCLLWMGCGNQAPQGGQPAVSPAPVVAVSKAPAVPGAPVTPAAPTSTSAAPAPAPGALTIETVSASLTSAQDNCRFSIQYPQVKGGAAPAVVSALNDALTRAFLVKDDEHTEGACDDKAKRVADEIQGLEVSAEVALNDRGLLSVYYSRTNTRTQRKSGEIIGAYPNNSLRAFSFDAATGQPLSLKAQFLPGSKYQERLRAIVEPELEGLSEEMRTTPPADGYFFYLRPGLLVIFNLTDIHAAQATEVEIPLRDLADIIDPASPLARALSLAPVEREE